MRKTVLFAGLVASPLACAQTASDALTLNWDAICAGATGALAQRCLETNLLSSAPDADAISARGQRLEEIPGQARVASRDSDRPDPPATTVITEGTHWDVHASVSRSDLARSTSPTEAAFDADATTLGVGLDWRPSAAWTLGVLAQTQREELDYRRSDGYLRASFDGVLAHAAWWHAGWSVTGYAGHLRGDYTLRRRISYTLPSAAGPLTVTGTADARPDVYRDVAGIGADRTWASGPHAWRVGAGLDRIVTRIEAYTESGGNGFAISLPKRRAENRRARLDAQWSKAISSASGVWLPQVGVSVYQELANPRRAIGVRFVDDRNATLVRFDTEDPDRLWWEAGIGVAWVRPGGHSGFVELRQRFGHAFFDERQFALGWRIEWR